VPFKGDDGRIENHPLGPVCVRNANYLQRNYGKIPSESFLTDFFRVPANDFHADNRARVPVLVLRSKCIRCSARAQKCRLAIFIKQDAFNLRVIQQQYDAHLNNNGVFILFVLVENMAKIARENI